MILLSKKAGRHGDPQLESLSARYCLDEVARNVLSGPTDDEDALRAIVALGQTLAARGEAVADLSFFLIAWGAERIAALRIAAGDLGIDEAAAHVAALRDSLGTEAALRGSAAWQQAVSDYRLLADEIFIDTLNEFREFRMVVLYSGQRDVFLRRWAAGQRVLAGFCPDLGTSVLNDDLPPLALAG